MLRCHGEQAAARGDALDRPDRVRSEGNEAGDEHADPDADRVPGHLRDVTHVFDHPRNRGDLDDGADETEQHPADQIAANGDGDTPLPERDSKSTSVLIKKGSMRTTLRIAAPRSIRAHTDSTY
ncbi:MAG: hypothetical protein JWM72_90 [Actinomycetia bacterium]|jgi:hypothetical protein|nr:hypothetical protein [Actinomycetes bacterium]MDQ1461667.1 hypothetical protein [Actinomycetota bacterium]